MIDVYIDSVATILQLMDRHDVLHLMAVTIHISLHKMRDKHEVHL